MKLTSATWRTPVNAATNYRGLWDRLRPLSHQAIADPSKLDQAKKFLFSESRSAFEALSKSLDELGGPITKCCWTMAAKMRQMVTTARSG